MSKKRRSGRLLSCWIPDRDAWVFTALEEIQQAFERRGIPKSMGELVRLVLCKELASAWEEIKSKTTKDGDSTPK